MTEHKDVILAILGASAGIAGLTLVFLGLVIASLQGFAPGTREDVIKPFRRPAMTTIVAFGASIVSVALATIWLIKLGDVHWIYDLTVWIFFVQLVVLAAAVVHVMWKIVWSH